MQNSNFEKASYYPWPWIPAYCLPYLCVPTKRTGASQRIFYTSVAHNRIPRSTLDCIFCTIFAHHWCWLEIPSLHFLLLLQTIESPYRSSILSFFLIFACQRSRQDIQNLFFTICACDLIPRPIFVLLFTLHLCADEARGQGPKGSKWALGCQDAT